MDIREDSALRMKLWAGLLEADEVLDDEHIRQHELLPCVRKGVATRIAEEVGEKVADRKSALYFLRGMSAEALIKKGNGKRVVHMGITCSTDWWTGGLHNFIEIKSTVMSSSHLWKSVKAGKVDLDKPNKMLSWLKQCTNYCVANQVTSCWLVVFFLHGDYAERRTKCPECGSRDLEDGKLYKRCRECNYKSFYIDLRAYVLDFTPEEIEAAKQDVFVDRQWQFRAAWEHWKKNHDKEKVLALAPATPNFYCATCKPGRLVGCDWYGVKDVE